MAATGLLRMLQQTRKRKKLLILRLLHKILPYTHLYHLGSSLKKVINLFQISLFSYKMVNCTNFSPKKVCKVRKKEFSCFMLITVVFPPESLRYNVKSGKNCFYTLAYSPNYIQVIELRFGLISEVKLSSKMTLTWTKKS